MLGFFAPPRGARVCADGAQPSAWTGRADMVLDHGEKVSALEIRCKPELT